MEFQPIGVIRTPHKAPEEMPVQPVGATGVSGRIELEPDLAEGLRDLDGFSHIIVLYCFHRTKDTALTVTPFLGRKPHGIFATRAPVRPNPIGLSILKLTGIDDAVLSVENVDMLDGTPVLDIKPYVPAFDLPVGKVRTGWFAEKPGAVRGARSDRRFTFEG